MIAGVRDIFLGAAEEQGAIVGVDQFSRTDGLQALDILLRLQRLVLVILINLI